MHFLPPASSLFFYITTALVLVFIPGPNVLYIVARSVGQGCRAGLASASGIATGLIVHVLAATVGLSALMVRSPAACAIVKYAGAAYLIYLGIKKFRERPTPDDTIKDMQELALRPVYAQGVVVQVLNPDTAVFFFAFLPQFVSPARGNMSMQFFILGMLFAVFGLLSYSSWALAAGSVAGWLRHNQAFIRNQHYVVGMVYLGLGLASATNAARHN
jgi:threonine/homoserine/homoserine lactone efflux protein